MSSDCERHIQRQREILAAHPEIRQYFCNTPLSIVPIALLVIAQWSIASIVSNMPWWAIGLSALLCGQFIRHALFVFVHEAAHRRILKSKSGNRMVLFLIEIGALSFGETLKYVSAHAPSHHNHLNDYYRDFGWLDRCQVDNFLAKPLWRCFEAFLHLLPGGPLLGSFLMNRLGGQDTRRYIEQHPFSIAFQYFLMATSLSLYVLAWQFLGWGAALYLFWSISIFSGYWGITAQGETIAEHNVCSNGGTFSTYGWINLFLFNVGYHDEHHTFPQVSWMYLPKVHALASKSFQESDGGKSYFGWWWQWMRSGFKPEKSHRYEVEIQAS
ncbi:MAG: fatty acid desaturase [Cyanobacteria bacterium SBLK]|nr:fatty acid desaturase [Cyanobacteria bacterium SBLK]